MRKILLTIAAFALLISGCARAPLSDSSEALISYEETLEINDDLGWNSLHAAIENLIKTWEKKNRDEMALRFGPHMVPASVYFAALEGLLLDLRLDRSGGRFVWSLLNNFDVYVVYGNEEPGDVLVTSYYDPIIKGSPFPTRKYSQAVYRKPKDLVTIRLDRYEETFPRAQWVIKAEQDLRGRVVRATNGGMKPPRIVPYYSRHEIDVDQKLGSQKLEIAYVDPVDSFVMQIQGAGTIHMTNGKKISLGYDGQNGHKYVALEKILAARIPKEAINMQAIENYLRSVPKTEAQESMDQNPSYVFFKKLDGPSKASFGSSLMPGRTIATDRGLFPKGTLAFLEFSEPRFVQEESGKIKRDEYGRPYTGSWVKKSRFVIDADTGGAIRGSGRLDLYWGKGRVAARVAGVMNQRGRLFYFVPKPSYIEALGRSSRLKND